MRKEFGGLILERDGWWHAFWPGLVGRWRELQRLYSAALVAARSEGQPLQPRYLLLLRALGSPSIARFFLLLIAQILRVQKGVNLF